jgi:hypothetical protein
MNELTYIRGAGASYQSIPIVQTFCGRFKNFLSFLNEISIDYNYEDRKRTKFKRAYDLSKDLFSAFENHQSFDTYFKKLFHTGQAKKINEAKKILNLYFIWEHLSNPVGKPQNETDSVFWKQSSVDKRYDALIAGLLRPVNGKSKPYCKINFITWNYDLNLLSSLKNYYLPNGTFKDFFARIDKNNGVWTIDDEISIFNMNGYFYSSQFDALPDLENTSIHNVIFNQIQEGYFEDVFSDKDANLIKFAWEENTLELKNVKAVIEKSKNIIVIGYTFPLYNRFVDLQYLDRRMINTKKIILQDPNSENIKITFLEMLDFPKINIPEAHVNIVTKKNCDYFYVPSNIFTEEDSTFFDTVLL